MVSAGSITNFVESHPTVKVLALSFLLLIGVALIAEGVDLHIPKGHIYFAMAFSVFVEVMNLRLRKRQGNSLRLRRRYEAERKGQLLLHLFWVGATYET